jgi:hypothetical protein
VCYACTEPRTPAAPITTTVPARRGVFSSPADALLPSFPCFFRHPGFYHSFVTSRKMI